MSKRRQMAEASVMDDTPVVPSTMQDMANAGYGDIVKGQAARRLVFAEDGTLRIGRVTMTRVGLPPGADMTEAEYQTVGEILLTMQGSLQWLLGDWLAYGDDRRWGTTYRRVAETVGYEIDSLYNLASVCRHVHFSLRNEKLSFTHHTYVQALEPDDQQMWLARAVENRWTTRQLYEAINPRSKGGTPTFWETSLMKPNNRMVKLWNRARAGDDDARQEALEMVERQRKWLDEFEAGLTGQ